MRIEAPRANFAEEGLDGRNSVLGNIEQTVTVSKKVVNSKMWPYTARGTALRLFATCWLIYTLHFATNIVREIYPALALGDHFSFRVDEYANMHPDLFEKEGYGWHIGNNPGASMIAAIPYALTRPIIDPLVDRINRNRAANGQSDPPSYDSPWPMAREFYAEAWRRGFDVKFGLAAFVMQSLAMAPSSALGVVAMFYALQRLTHSKKAATGLALLYAFGTPVFFRTGFLNHNLMLGHISFLGFLALWNPAGGGRFSVRTRYLTGGLAGGTAVLFDYSGLVFLLGLFGYGLYKRLRTDSAREALQSSFWYFLGSLGPIALLWFYQWRSFGHPFYPGQHWMPPVEWIGLGYQGYGLPQLELLLMLAFDYRFGLFLVSPLMLLAIAAPIVIRRARIRMPRVELVFCLVLFLALWVFFSGSNYTRLQFNTGIRYLAPILPFLFLPVSVVLARLPRPAIYFVSVFSLASSWSLAMYRDVESGPGILNPILKTFLSGFQLPVVNTLANLGDRYEVLAPDVVSPLPLFALTAAILYGIWSTRIWRAGPRAQDSS